MSKLSSLQELNKSKFSLKIVPSEVSLIKFVCVLDFQKLGGDIITEAKLYQ